MYFTPYLQNVEAFLFHFQKVNYQLPVTLVVEDPEGKDLSFSISPSEGSSNFQVDAKGITLKKVIDLKDQPDTTYTCG